MAEGRILVVDDDRNILELMKIRLESADYSVATAADEDDAFQMIKDEVFDIAIVDLQLVRTDGISLMQNTQYATRNTLLQLHFR